MDCYIGINDSLERRGLLVFECDSGITEMTFFISLAIIFCSDGINAKLVRMTAGQSDQ